MSAVERRLHEALTGQPPGSEVPAADLFTRVTGSIADDRARRRVARFAWALTSLLILAVAGTALALRAADRSLAMQWWVLELGTTTALVATALWLGPFIKRFGRAYAADVFHDNPLTGKSYIVLADIVYYLIFASYILFTLRFNRAGDWSQRVGPQQLQHETARVAGILLVIGALHGLNIVLMPVLGRLFSLNTRLGPRPAARLREVGGEEQAAP